MKRPRSDSKLEQLDQDQKRELCEWLLTPGLSYKRIRELVKKEFGISVAASAFTPFYQVYVLAYMIEKRREAVGVANEVTKEIERSPGQFSRATVDSLEQVAFRLAQNPNVDPRNVKSIFSLVLKAHEMQFDREKFAVATCETFLKWSKDEAARSIAASNISNQDKIVQLRKHYFADIDALEKSGAVNLPK